MAGWHPDGNGTSVSATERLRAAFPGRRRAVAPEPDPEETPEVAEGLREERLHHVTAYIGAYPEDEDERNRCNQALHEPEQPLEQAS
jgi:hypothetical protein